MTQELAFFPLKLVAFPEEELNLHIFEPRYKQLISECLVNNKSFGICTFIDKLMPLGTEMMVREVTKRYKDGRMDIKTKGLKTFKILDFNNPLEGKLYAGGKVEIIPLDKTKASIEKKEAFASALESLYELMEQPLNLGEIADLNSFAYAHKVGLKLTEEYALLSINHEEERLDFLMQHFQKIIPILKEIESSKHKIKMNGHFKYLDPLNF
ncbi:LON peptidase substrate-binding domain-containing protein [Cyclobacterium plantarum]|uniref:Peptidase n=1 Tax=Cyclobacterium plantarum TaxID=2716263 RepID=A0ABX0HH82_9BACT|nr:LON peptidase substrate-binding domain-containing protein [Cyclobacterium plantarum]NHE59405.1 peptidase [Cyclobacterium plantarum]